VRKTVEGYQPQIAGELKVEGRITGKLSDPTIEGNLNASSISLHDELLGSLTGRLLFSPTEVRLEDWLLTATNNGTVKLNYEAPRDQIATEGRLDATLERISVDTLFAAAGLSRGQKLISGELSGEAHLTSLPASPQGVVNIKLLNGTIGGQTAELATANLIIDGQTVRLDRTEIRLPQGLVVANGSLDLKSNSFQLQGKAESVDLGALVISLGVENPQIRGTADATLQASGNIKEIEQLLVELSADGKDVTINGKAAGQLTITARTNQNGRIDLDLLTGIVGKPQSLHASIEMRKPGRPIEIETEMTEFDLAPLTSIFAPELASSIVAVIAGRLQIAGPTVNERGEVTLEPHSKARR
jgi:hypothetical protein